MKDNIETDIFDYIVWRGDLGFDVSPFNEVDALAFSILSYLDYSCIGNAVWKFDDFINHINQLPNYLSFSAPDIIMPLVIKLANEMATSSRYRNVRVFGFSEITDNEREIQFAAVTFDMPYESLFVSFRGTDNSFVGWKEDLNMCFMEGIPSQLEATKYLNEIISRTNKYVRLGGHSKGGNLAIWASANVSDEHKERIIDIYGNDAPGFSGDFLEKDIYLKIRNKIHSFVPESSIVGVLMEHEDYITICSRHPSILQHNPFTWVVQGPRFVYDDSRSFSGRQFERVINSWLRAMDKAERETLVENIYDIIRSSNAKTVDDIKGFLSIDSMLSMSKTFTGMGIKKQAQLISSLSKVFLNKELYDDIFLVDSEVKEIRYE